MGFSSLAKKTTGISTGEDDYMWHKGTMRELLERITLCHMGTSSNGNTPWWEHPLMGTLPDALVSVGETCLNGTGLPNHHRVFMLQRKLVHVTVSPIYWLWKKTLSRWPSFSGETSGELPRWWRPKNNSTLTLSWRVPRVMTVGLTFSITSGFSAHT